MVKRNEIYKCSVCGNVVEVKEVGGGVLVCCGQDMNLCEEKTVEQEGKEKHVPVISIEGDKVTVAVGSVPHPMEDKHFIEFIQLLKDGKVIKEKQLYPGEKPEAVFTVDNTDGLSAREYCNLHGLWRS